MFFFLTVYGNLKLPGFYLTDNKFSVSYSGNVLVLIGERTLKGERI